MLHSGDLIDRDGVAHAAALNWWISQEESDDALVATRCDDEKYLDLRGLERLAAGAPTCLACVARAGSHRWGT